MKNRCTYCNELLAIGTGEFEIKCPRCKTVNKFGSLTTQNTNLKEQNVKTKAEATHAAAGLHKSSLKHSD